MYVLMLNNLSDKIINLIYFDMEINKIESNTTLFFGAKLLLFQKLMYVHYSHLFQYSAQSS